MGYRLDEIDRRILYDLMIDARHISAPEIAEKLDVSPGTVRNRITNLETAGVITGFHVAVDFAEGEDYLQTLYICTAPVEQKQILAEKATQISGVNTVQQLMGNSENIHITAAGESTHDLDRISRELTAIGLSVDREQLIQSTTTVPFAPYSPDDRHHTPRVPDLISLSGGSEIIELTASSDAPIVGNTLAEAVQNGLLDEDTLVISIEREDSFITPRGQTEIEPYDIVTILSRDDVEKQTIAAFE